jgi:hypothetical protein
MVMYMTPMEAEDRVLGRYGIDVGLRAIHIGDVMSASQSLDASAPFVGEPADQGQEFPRSGETEVPASILDWVALEAYRLSRAEEPPTISKSVQSLGARTYARPMLSREERIQSRLLHPYLKRTGSRL